MQNSITKVQPPGGPPLANLKIESLRLVIFDLDGVLAPSRQPISNEVAKALDSLTPHFLVGIISGGSWRLFLENVIQSLRHPNRFYLMPTSGASLYTYETGWWKAVYTLTLPPDEVHFITNMLGVATSLAGETYQPPAEYGPQIENRGTQITFSGLGQNAPLDLKLKWDADRRRRLAIVKELRPLLGQRYEVVIGGTTSIDVTRRGIHKGFGVAQLLRRLGLAPEEALFIGDQLEVDGNDYPVIETGVPCIAAAGVASTLKLITSLKQAVALLAFAGAPPANPLGD